MTFIIDVMPILNHFMEMKYFHFLVVLIAGTFIATVGAFVHYELSNNWVATFVGFGLELAGYTVMLVATTWYLGVLFS